MDLKRKTSIIWNFFTPEDELKALCNFCKQKFSYKSSTTNLKAHITRKHPSIKLDVLPKEKHSTISQAASSECDRQVIQDQEQEPSLSPASPKPSTSTSTDSTEIHPPPVKKRRFHQTTISVPKKIGFSQKKQLDEYLLALITKDFQPFSIVEDVGFREYSNALNPNYTVPSRKVLSNVLLPAKYTEVYNNTKEVIKDAVSVTITTDCWTSRNVEGFIAVTSHFITPTFETKSVVLETSSYNENHTSANLAAELNRIIREWNLENKILLAVSDNAANIKKAIKEDLKWRHFGCLAHTINLIVQDALKSIEPLIEKAKALVSHFKKSSNAKTKLDFYQKQNNKEAKKATFYMFQRIFELKEEIRATIAVLGKENWPIFSNEEFETIEQSIKVLAPMETVTRMMSGEKYVPASSVIIITNGLQDVYEQMLKKIVFEQN
jgi:hypothetical protein